MLLNLGRPTQEDGSDDPVEALKQFLQDQVVKANLHEHETWKHILWVLGAQVPFSVTETNLDAGGSDAACGVKMSLLWI